MTGYDRRTLLRAAGGSLSALLAGCNSSEVETTTYTRTATATETATPTATPSPTPANTTFERFTIGDRSTSVDTIDDIATTAFQHVRIGELPFLPKVTARNHDRKIDATLQLENPDGIERVEVVLQGANGKRPLQQLSREFESPSTSVEIERGILAQYIQPGKDKLHVYAYSANPEKKKPDRATVQGGENLSIGSKPFVIDFTGQDLENSTERIWDNIQTLAESQKKEFYYNDVEYQARHFKGASGWQDLEPLINKKIKDYSQRDGWNWIETLTTAVGTGLDERTDFASSGGLMEPLVAGIKKYGKEEFNKNLDDFVVWDAPATKGYIENDTADILEDHHTALIYDKKDEKLWVTEPDIDDPIGTKKPDRNKIRPFKDSKYAKKNNIADSLGFNFNKQKKLAEKGIISNEEVHRNISTSLENIFDSSRNDITNNFDEYTPSIYFSESYVSQLNDMLYDLDGNGEKFDRIARDAEKLAKVDSTHRESDKVAVYGEVGNMKTVTNAENVDDLKKFDYDDFEEKALAS